MNKMFLGLVGLIMASLATEVKAGHRHGFFRPVVRCAPVYRPAPRVYCAPAYRPAPVVQRSYSYSRSYSSYRSYNGGYYGGYYQQPVVYTQPVVVQTAPVVVYRPMMEAPPPGFTETGRKLRDNGMVDKLYGYLNGRRVEIEYKKDGRIDEIDDD